MWNCRYCKEEFSFERTTEKANHSRWCEANPDRLSPNIKRARMDWVEREFGPEKEFSVSCDNCGTTFLIVEREKKFPTKDKYFCCRACANSIGGRAKADKYGITAYGTIAEKHHEKKCLVCGITDVLEVHHIDGNRANNDWKNLGYLCPNDHMRLHRNGNTVIMEVIQRYQRGHSDNE